MGQAGRDKQTHNLALGHASIKMTEKYLQVIDNQKKDAMNSLGRISFRRDDIFSRESSSDVED